MNKNPGPINVNGDITPITHQPIAQLDAHDWNTLTTDELFEQRAALQQRIIQVQQMSLDPAVAKQMQHGLDRIDYIIHDKLNPTPTEFS